MRLTSGQVVGKLHPATHALMQRMLTPMVGITPTIGFLSRGDGDPRFAVAGADMTGVHVLRNEPAPKTGFYHIGGGGVFYDEAMIRSLGEGLERYSQFVSEVSGQFELEFASYNAMRQRYANVLSADCMRFFAPEAYATKDFMYDPFDADAPMAWLEAPSLVAEKSMWVPAQLFLAGYAIRRSAGEPWLLSAVTTGSAAHTSPQRAVRGALLEIIQVDAAMGHWFGDYPAIKIQLDDRTAALNGLIETQFAGSSLRPDFYLLRSPDLPGFHVACVLREQADRLPRVAIGLGSDMRLAEAMYKAILEGAGVLHLARLTLAFDEAPADDQFADLDSNVAYYADGNNAAIMAAKFPEGEGVPASALPPDCTGDVDEQVAKLVRGFADAGMELLFRSLTTPDIDALGFVAVRAWCPNTMSLCLPGYPPSHHQRMKKYGGFVNPKPHPYP